ncbi:hypothetical protein BE15_41075 [Sorangium cellulosum]|uniref:Uncharacterized protein n=1 Tax=Sorangium cellulosum TaxID=56 RepID=A0A150QTN8_SORCE|nr:hypothetical protein BE15_41075 [Sorangium cellulosum]
MRRADSFASSRNMVTTRSPSAAMSRWRLTTTSLLKAPGPRATARNTSPMPPRPSFAIRRYLPMIAVWVGSASEVS